MGHVRGKWAHMRADMVKSRRSAPTHVCRARMHACMLLHLRTLKPRPWLPSYRHPRYESDVVFRRNEHLTRAVTPAASHGTYGNLGRPRRGAVRTVRTAHGKVQSLRGLRQRPATMRKVQRGISLHFVRVRVCVCACVAQTVRRCHSATDVVPKSSSEKDTTEKACVARRPCIAAENVRLPRGKVGTRRPASSGKPRGQAREQHRFPRENIAAFKRTCSLWTEKGIGR